MYDYDYSKLLGRIKEKGFTQETLAPKLGISACSLNLALNNNREFKQEELVKACETLDIPLAKIADYFFTHKL